MTRERLRPAHPPERLAEIYARRHDHRKWRDHQLRVAATIEVGKWMCEYGGFTRAADLSCGNGAILEGITAGERHYGDLAPSPFAGQLTGPIEETIEQIPRVDLFVCAETLEHLDDPDKVLAAIRPKTRMLLLSTPVDAWDDPNEEHYWAWSRADVGEMLDAAGFHTLTYLAVDFRMHPGAYQFGIWGLK